MKWTVLAYVLGAALSWGIYVPVVHEATTKLGSNLRAFLMVGVAYFLVAVVVPCFFIFILNNDPTAKDPSKLNWLSANMGWGIAAGTAGAIGALCVIFAVRDAGSVGPLIVAPLVFAMAPIINTIATMTVFAHGRKMAAPGPLFYLGLLLAAGGMAMVWVNKPRPLAPAPAASAQTAPADFGKASETRV